MIPRRVLLAVLLTCLWRIAQAETVMEVIELRHRPVDQVVPILRPMVPPPGAVSGMHNQLIIRTTPENMAQIKSILEQIDTRLQRLKITVRQARHTTAGQDSAGLSGRYNVGDVTLGAGAGGRDRSGVTVMHRDGDGRIRYQLSERETEQTGNVSQHVQVLEGGQAFIRTGQEVPVPQRTVIINGRRTIVSDTTQYQSLTTGFYVRPRLNGDRVTLEISQHSAQPGSLPYSAEVQSTSTIVSGALGEWIGIGGVAGGSDRDTRHLTGRDRLTTSDNTDIQLRVEIAP